MGSKSNMSVKRIEAYSLDSSYRVQGDSHCFVVTEDKKTSWKNHGRGWDSGEGAKFVASNDAYWEWLLNFVPPTNVDKCGISFGVNGLCHTYAAREMLMGKNNADVSAAPKDYLCVFYFGKYGLGLKELKELLTLSYKDTMVSYYDPYNALNTVLGRVDDTIDYELSAWRKVAMEYCRIPVDEILNKNYSGGLEVARSRMRTYITKREEVYESHKEHASTLEKAISELMQSESDEYLRFLANFHYITELERALYSKNISDFLNSLVRYVNAQRVAYAQTGALPENIRIEDYLVD